MKKLLLLVLLATPFLSFKPTEPVDGLGGLKNLIGHTWQIDYKQVMGGPDITSKITYSKGATDNVINFKDSIYNDTTGKYEPASEGTMVYNTENENIYYSCTIYFGDIEIGEVTTDGDNFSIHVLNHTDKTEHFYFITHKYTKVDNDTYEVRVYIDEDDEPMHLLKGTLSLIK